MNKWLKLLGIALILLSLRFTYTLALGAKMLLTFNSFNTTRNLDLVVIQFLSKQLPLTYSILISFLISSLLLVAAVYYFNESIGPNQELGFYATFIYVTSVPTYIFLGKVPLIYDATSLVLFIATLYSLSRIELRENKKILNFFIFVISWGIIVFEANILVQIFIFSFLAIVILINFHKDISFLKNKIVIIITFVITVFLILEKNSSYFYTMLFTTLFFMASYSLLNEKVIRGKTNNYLVKVQNKLITILKKPSVLLLTFIAATGSSIFFNDIDKNFLCIIISLIINFYFFAVGFNKNTNKEIELFVPLMLIIYLVSLIFNSIIPFEYFANYLVLISASISGAGIKELVENSNLTDRYMFTYIISYFSILLLAIPLLVF